MTPQDYQVIERVQKQIISLAERTIYNARTMSDQCECPSIGEADRAAATMMTLQDAFESYKKLYHEYRELEWAQQDDKIKLHRYEEALQKIRHAGQNTHPTAQWMQKVAAHAMEPMKWPEQPEQPPYDDDLTRGTTDQQWARFVVEKLRL